MTSLATYEQYSDAKMILSSPNNELFSEEQMQQFLDHASSYLESMCYQPLREAEYTETYVVGSLYCSISDNGWLNIFPRRAPITAVASVSYRSTPGGDLTELDTDTWALDDLGRITVPFSPVPRLRWIQIVVVYTAGYVDGAIPGDIVEACILVAAHFASGGYAAVDSQGNDGRPVVPNWAWGNGRGSKSIVDEVINRYQRQF